MTRIGTHSGNFHVDEALACYLLKTLPEYADAEIVRTRDPAVIDSCDIVVDVGGKYDPATHRYDHHQREFTGTLRTLAGLNFDTKLSSAGLVYLHFGKRVIQTLAQTDEKTTEILWHHMYVNFVEELDAIDNGISQYDGTPKYQINSTLSARVGKLNPSWQEENPDYDALFQRAVAMAGAEFSSSLSYYVKDWLPARVVVEKALAARFDVDASGEVIELDSACPWKSHLFDIEAEMGGKVNIKYAIFTDTAGKWRIMCVPTAPSAFSCRLTLPEKWRGVRDQALSDLTGIPGCIFVHAGGFIGGNDTKEGVLAMARASLAMAATEKAN